MTLGDTELTVCEGATWRLKQCTFIPHHLFPREWWGPRVPQECMNIYIWSSWGILPECRFPIPKASLILSQQNKTKQKPDLCIPDVISLQLASRSEILPVCLTPQWYQIIAFPGFLWQKFYASQVAQEHRIPSQNPEYFIFLYSYSSAIPPAHQVCSPWRHHYGELCSTWADWGPGPWQLQGPPHQLAHLCWDCLQGVPSPCFFFNEDRQQPVEFTEQWHGRWLMTTAETEKRGINFAKE